MNKQKSCISSIFRYPGGKTKKSVREWILSHAPSSFSEYREPFVGGGGIFFSIDPDKSRWINDADECLLSVYRALKERPQDFIDRCRGISVYDKSKREQEFARLKKEFDKIAFDENADPALRFFFVNRTVFGGRVNYERKSRLYFSKPEGWTETILDRLSDICPKMSGVNITCGDYSDLLKKEGKDVWIYCDPPYVKPLKSTSLLYRYNFEKIEQHERLAHEFSTSPHMICLSYEDDPDGIVRKLYKNYRIIERGFTYAGTWNPDDKGKDTKRKGIELLILNYDISK